MVSNARSSSPVVIGGIGGSGSRVIARVLERSGLFIGTNRNESEDALELAAFDYKWAPPLVAAAESSLPRQQADAMKSEFAAALARHRLGVTDAQRPWGWKHMPSIHLLPFIHEIFPEMRFVHVLRDGRDLAFGTGGSRAHVLRLGRAVLDGDPQPLVKGPTGRWRGHRTTAEGEQEATPSRQARFWARVHSACADYGESRMGESYMRIRFEDLCDRPEEVVEPLLSRSALDWDLAISREVRSEVQYPSSIGRWRHMDPAQIAEVIDIARPTLERFGYL